jgi:hypothetical protein
MRALQIETPSFAVVTGCQIKSAAANHVVLMVPAHWTAVVGVNRDDAKALHEMNRREMQEHQGMKGR